MPFHDHFSKRAAQYATARPTYPPALAEFLAATAPGARVWEAGCGSGQLTRVAAGHFPRWIATDPSYAQLQHAPAINGVSWHCAAAEASALRDQSVGLAIAAQAAHWFNVERFYDEVRRVARPNGVVALVSYANGSVDDDVDQILHDFHFNFLRDYWPPERRHVDRSYETIPFPFEIIPSPRMEMHVDWNVDGLLNYIGTWSAVQAFTKQKGDAPLQEVFRKLRVAWGEPAAVKTMTWQLAVKTGKV